MAKRQKTDIDYGITDRRVEPQCISSDLNLPGSTSFSSDLGRDKKKRIIKDEGRNPSRTIVFIWDLDETLIIFQSLISGKFSLVHEGKKDMQTGLVLGKRWEDLILNFCDDNFFFKQMEDFDQPNVYHLSKYDDGIDLNLHDFESDDFSKAHKGSIKNNLINAGDWHLRFLAYRYRKIVQLYSQKAEHLLNEKNLINEWQDAYSKTDQFTDGWLSSGLHALRKLEVTNFDSNPLVFDNANERENEKQSNGNNIQNENKFHFVNSIDDRGLKTDSAFTHCTDGKNNNCDEKVSMNVSSKQFQNLDRNQDSGPNCNEKKCQDKNEDVCPNSELEQHSQDRVQDMSQKLFPQPSSNHHILVSSGQLIPTLAKCILFQLNQLIHPRNIYSSRHVGKLQCFKWIQSRFEKSNVEFCVIGDGLEELEASQTMNWPFIPIHMLKEKGNMLNLDAAKVHEVLKLHKIPAA